jgi:hypothetical protein
MASVLIGTEVAEGMGHVAPWLDFCRMAIVAGHSVHVAAPDTLVLYRCIGSVSDAKIWAAPRPPPSPQQATARSWPELLLNLGYGQPDALVGTVAAWVSLLETIAPDVVVADYAPALMAASHGLGIHYLEMGGGFCVPPLHADGGMPPFPGLKDSDAARVSTHTALAALDAALRQGVGRWRGRTHNVRWADLHRGAKHRLVVSPAAFDHYDDRAQDSLAAEYVGFLGLSRTASAGREAPPRLVRSPGDHQSARRVVGYLKGSTPRLDAVVAGLRRTGLAGRVYVPGARDLPQREALEIVSEPIDLASELSPETLFVTNGGLASVGLACRKGAQRLLIPQQVEQVAMLRRLSLQSAESDSRRFGRGTLSIAAEERILQLLNSVPEGLKGRTPR